MLTICANLDSEPTKLSDLPQGRLMWVEGNLDDSTLGPWTVAWFIDDVSDRDAGS